MRIRKRWLALGVLAVAVAAAAAAIAYRPARMHRRLALIGAKLGGAELPWADVIRKTATPIGSWHFHGYARAKATGAEPCPVLWESRMGDFWANRDHDSLGQVVFEQTVGIYEHGGVRIRKGDVVLDIGAHYGAFTRLALLRGAAQVIAVEPMPATAACLERTFGEEIAQGRVRVVKEAIWESVGGMNFHGAGLTASAGAGGESLRVPTTTVDALVAKLGLARVDFVKMDIEGAERNALAGAGGALAKHGPRMALCTYHKADDPELIPALVKGARADYRYEFNPTREQAFFEVAR